MQARAPRQSAGSPPAPAAGRAPAAPPSPLSPSHSPAARRGAAARTTSRDDRAERPSPSESPPDPDAGPASRAGPAARRPASPSLALLSAFDASLGGAAQGLKPSAAFSAAAPAASLGRPPRGATRAAGSCADVVREALELSDDVDTLPVSPADTDTSAHGAALPCCARASPPSAPVRRRFAAAGSATSSPERRRTCTTAGGHSGCAASRAPLQPSYSQRATASAGSPTAGATATSASVNLKVTTLQLGSDRPPHRKAWSPSPCAGSEGRRPGAPSAPCRQAAGLQRCPRRRRRCRRRPWPWASKGAPLAAWARPARAQRPRSARPRCRWPAPAHAGFLHTPCPAQLGKHSLCAPARPGLRHCDSPPPHTGPGRAAAQSQPASARGLSSSQSCQRARAAVPDVSATPRALRDRDGPGGGGCTCGCGRGAAAARRLSASASASACRSVSPTARAHAAQHQPRQVARRLQRLARSRAAPQRLPRQPDARAAAQTGADSPHARRRPARMVPRDERGAHCWAILRVSRRGRLLGGSPAAPTRASPPFPADRPAHVSAPSSNAAHPALVHAACKKRWR